MKAKLSKILPMVLAVVLAVGLMPAIAIADAEVAVDGDPAVVLSDQGEDDNGETGLSVKENAATFVTAPSAPAAVYDNGYADPDTTFIRVKKTFTGIDSISQVKSNYAIQINPGNFTLRLGDTNCERVNEFEYIWTVPVAAGTYTVKEVNAGIDDYALEATANGKPLPEGGVQVTTKASELKVVDKDVITPCSQLDWDTSVLDGRALVVAFTDNTYIVLTKDTLSDTEQHKFQQEFGNIKNIHLGKNAFSSITFYSGKAIEKGIAHSGAVISYNPDTKKLDFGDPSQWTMWGNGTVVINTAQDEEITIGNAYTPVPRFGSLKISKTVTGNAASTSTHYTMQISGLKGGASYDVAVTGGTDSHPATITASSAGVAEITLCHGETAVISGIAANTAVSVTEVGLEKRSGQTTVVDVNGKEVASYGYNGTQGYVEAGSTLETKPAAVTIAADATQAVAFANDLIVEPNTGFGMDVLPFALVLILAMAGFGFYFFFGRNRLNLKGSSGVWKE